MHIDVAQDLKKFKSLIAIFSRYKKDDKLIIEN